MKSKRKSVVSLLLTGWYRFSVDVSGFLSRDWNRFEFESNEPNKKPTFWKTELSRNWYAEKYLELERNRTEPKLPNRYFC